MTVKQRHAGGHPADQYIHHVDGPFAVIRTCRICKYADVLRKQRFGAGRGWGMREGNKQRGRLIQHIKEAHPDALTKEA